MPEGGNQSAPEVTCHGSLCACRPPSADPEDYEIRVQVDFENRLLRPLSVAGINEDARSEVLLFAKEKCQPNCATAGCPKCRTRKLYQDSADNPKGAVAFRLHSEYLYCLRFNQQPVTALLSLTPREQNVEVKELGLLACWFANWFQRAKADNPSDAGDLDDDGGQLQRQASTKAVANATAAAAAEGGFLVAPWNAADASSAAVTRTSAPAATRLSNVNASSKYLPNLRVIYQVKKELMKVFMPDPHQLTREIEVLLYSRCEPNAQPQSVTLRPGESQASGELQTSRDTPYTLMMRLKDQGHPVKLLELVTECKVLRVQESLLAPKHMNFLMERCVGQRATFVLHITFDEKAIEVDSKWLGEFYLDVDIEKKSLSIGTAVGHERKTYKVEQLIGPESEAEPLSARRVCVFEGGVNPGTLFTEEPIYIERMSDYLITVLDAASGARLPASVLSFRQNSLFVKEVKGSDVKLHVTVQRQFDSAVTNENNCPDPAETQVVTTEAHLPIVRRCQPDGGFQCPIREGCCAKYRILHNLGRHGGGGSGGGSTRVRAASPSSATSAAGEASCHSSGSGGRGVSCDDSGLGRNQSSLSESVHDSATQQHLQRLQHWQQLNEEEEKQQQKQQQRRQQQQRQQQQRQQQQQQQDDYNVNLDVDLSTLQARLLPGGGQDTDCGGSGCYLIVEDSLTDGRSRSVPCQLGQSFGVRHWCRYTVKAICDRRVNPLFTFRLTDAEVTDIRPCNRTVRLTKNVSQR